MTSSLAQEVLSNTDQKELFKLSPAYMAATLSKGKWLPARHLMLISRKIVDAVAKRTPRLIISMPPRHGKSEFTSKWCPLWYLFNNPDKNVIFISYEADFAATFGRAVRGMVQEYGEELGIQLSKDSSAANRWNLTAGGGMFSAGVGGPLTGKGAHFMIIDDPIKNSEEANSTAIRQSLNEWYDTTARTRLEPDGVLVVIMTRWFEDDLAGFLKQKEAEGGEHWETLILPALAEEDDVLGREIGEALWPERYSRDNLLAIKSNNSYTFATMYQQNPMRREGSLFNSANMHFINANQLPDKLRVKVRKWDFAATESAKGKDPDFTVGLLMGEKDGHFYILDMKRGQFSSKVVQDLVQTTAGEDGKRTFIHLFQDPGQAGKEQVDNYKRVLLKGYNTRSDTERKGKIENAQLFSAAVENGFVYVLIAPWNAEFKSEIDSFPYGKHDDIIDASSGAYNFLTSKKRILSPVKIISIEKEEAA